MSNLTTSPAEALRQNIALAADAAYTALLAVRAHTEEVHAYWNEQLRFQPCHRDPGYSDQKFDAEVTAATDRSGDALEAYRAACTAEGISPADHRRAYRATHPEA